MEGKAFVIMVLTGLCALPSCFPHQYHLVEELKNWTEAQSYCREKFTDLATVDNQEDMAKLHDITGIYHNGHVWIGLYDDINSWRWSLENKSYYGKGEAEFRMWASTKPSNLFTKTCAGMGTDAAWWDGRCNATFPFICYNGAIAAQDSSRFIFVNKSKTWTKAQSYCRERYTDLASVRNQAENDEIKTIIPQGTDAWIGLFRDSWKWSDGSATSITNWNTKNSEPKDNITEACGMSRVGKWETWLCSHRLFFVCYSAPLTKQVVRVKLTKTDSSVDMEDLKEAILQQMNQRLKDRGLSGDVKLRWVKQPDGKIFHKEEKEEEEESCNLI